MTLASHAISRKSLLLFVLVLVSSTKAALAIGSPDANLVGLYHLDEATGTTTYRDSSFSGNDGTCTAPACPTNVEMGKFNSAAAFDGNDEIVIPDANNLDNTSALTIQMWFFPTTLTGAPRGLVSKRTSAAAGQAYSIFLWTGNSITVDVDKQATNERFSITNTVQINRWYHVALVYDGSLSAANRVNVYFNGTLDPGSPFTEGSSSIANYTSDLYIGALNLAYAQDYIGVVDEVAIYNAALPADAIQDQFSRGLWRVHQQRELCGGSLCNFVKAWVLPTLGEAIFPNFHTREGIQW
ncbi:MAG: LamG domain-containing protein [Bdellovibrionaceae bacterium]|nr:LamG domain-containing protein [Pseudobdellovibrionaceae bacterium]